MPRHMRCPKGWRRLDDYEMAGVVCCRFLSPDGLLVATSQDEEPGGKRAWIHVSFSRPDRLPDYDDLQTARRNFIGIDRVSLQIFPVEEEYVDLHPNCLHLWSPVGFDPLLPEAST